MEDYPKIYLYRRIVQAKLFIDTNFADKIEISNIADEACFSRFHFMRLFKKIYCNTPHQYLIFVRMNRAKEFLSEGLQVSDVCFSVGFESVSSFTGLFKRSTGLTPSQFRRQKLDRKAAISCKPLKFIPNCFAEKHGWIHLNRNSGLEEKQFSRS